MNKMSPLDRCPYRLSLVLEEVGADFERSLSVAQELGIHEVEFGSLWGQRIDLVPMETMAKAKRLLDKYEMQVRVVAGPTFKIVYLGSVPLKHVEREPHLQEHLQILCAQLTAACFFDAPLARVFSFRREGMVAMGNPSPRYAQGGAFPEAMQEKVAKALSLACQEAEKAQVRLALENVRSCWGDSGRNSALILARVNSPWLGMIWDPANGFVSGEENAYPAGYAAVKPYISHVHLKDAVVEDKMSGLIRWERIGDGDVGLEAQMAALQADSYDGCVSIETHWSPAGGNKEANTRQTHKGLIEILERIQDM
jgi:sugar phosphate isomerase/epimerase